MFYVLLNMLLAIILDAYSTVKAEGENASPILRDAQTFGSMYHRRLQKEFSSKGYLEMSRTLAGLASTTHVQQVWDVDGSATNLSFALEGSHKVAARMWQEVDRDRSGSLDATEVWSVLRKIAPHLKETELIKMEAEIRADMDGDNDGQVTEQEFLDWWQNQPVNVQLKLCGGAVMTRDDIIEQLGVPESEARALFSEVQEDVEEVAGKCPSKLARWCVSVLEVCELSDTICLLRTLTQFAQFAQLALKANSLTQPTTKAGEYPGKACLVVGCSVTQTMSVTTDCHVVQTWSLQLLRSC